MLSSTSKGAKIQYIIREQKVTKQISALGTAAIPKTKQ